MKPTKTQSWIAALAIVFAALLGYTASDYGQRDLRRLATDGVIELRQWGWINNEQMDNICNKFNLGI